MPGRAAALMLAMVLAACDGPIRLDVVTAIPAERPGGGGGIGNIGNTGNIGSGNFGAGGGAGGTLDDGGAAGRADGGEAGAGEGPPPWEADTLYEASFASFALPGQYVRHENALGWVTPIDPNTVDAEDATFEIIPGMIGEGCFSIRRVGGDFSFMRHAMSRIFFNLAEDSPLFFGDATFCFEEGLAEETWVSLRSYNYPNRYVRMVVTTEGNELSIQADDGTAAFAAAATFRIENPFQY